MTRVRRYLGWCLIVWLTGCSSVGPPRHAEGTPAEPSARLATLRVRVPLEGEENEANRACYERCRVGSPLPHAYQRCLMQCPRVETAQGKHCPRRDQPPRAVCFERVYTTETPVADDVPLPGQIMTYVYAGVGIAALLGLLILVCSHDDDGCQDETEF